MSEPTTDDTVTGRPCPTCRDTVTLTSHEHAVLLYVVAGRGTRLIAQHTGLKEPRVSATLVTLRSALGAANREQVVDTACRLGLVPPAVPDVDLDTTDIGEPHIDVVTAAAHGLTTARTAEALGLEEADVIAVRRALFDATGLSRMTALIALFHALGKLTATHPCPRPDCVAANAGGAASTAADGVARWSQQMFQQAGTRLAHATAAHRLTTATARLAAVTRELQFATAQAEAAREQAQAALGQARNVADVWTALAASKPRVAEVARAAEAANRRADTADTRARQLLADIAQGEQLAQKLGEQLTDARLLWKDMGPAVQDLVDLRARITPGPVRSPDPPGSGAGGRPPVPAELRPWRQP
ncbi:hypothetical protein ACFC26_37120 [Kitasatospora purpeofusca]|uniref:hypothetical protein n=1 Tax=Kitasatospora purpeofusca TaxID=67352 RepID=UPI0035E1A1C9